MILAHKLSERYSVWFCDIWGVVHNGVRPFVSTVETLARHRKAGGTVVLVSNSPRTAQGVAAQLFQIGVDPAAHDAIVTSGDVTRDLMAHVSGGKLFHLGPDRDLSIFDGLAVERVAMESASAVVCTGLFHDDRETPADYERLLAGMRQQKLPMICANPDKQVRKGDRLLFCAGALADAYAAIGGDVAMAGKPYAPIYKLACSRAEELRQVSLARDAILAIGDGPETDIRGAANEHLDCLYVSGGVHAANDDLAAELAQVQALVPKARIIGAVRHLQWN